MHYVLSTCVVARKLSGIGLSACGGLSGRPALLSSANTQIFRDTSIMKVGVGVRVGPTKSRGKSGQTRRLVRRGATVFGDPLGRIVADPRHSSEEERFVLLALSQDQHLLAVMYVERGETIRIVSARRATRRERRNNEEIIQDRKSVV